MITLSLLQYLSDNGFGSIDKDLFWQKLPLGKNGISILDLGQQRNRKSLNTQKFEIISRGSSDTDGYNTLKDIVDFLNSSYNVCKLPSCPLIPESNSYENITIMPLSTPTNIGVNQNGRVIWSATGAINY